MVGEGEVESGKIKGPAGLSVVQLLGSVKVGQVLVVGVDCQDSAQLIPTGPKGGLTQGGGLTFLV